MVLVAIFAALRSPDKIKKLEGAKELREAVVSYTRESPKNSEELIREVFNKISELTRAPDASSKLGGVLAIDQLISVDLAEDNATRFIHYLRMVLLTPEIEVIKAAAAAIGHLTKSGGTLAGDLVDYEVKKCIEWLTLERNQEVKRLAAAIELRAIAITSPTLIFGYINDVVQALWSGIRDLKLTIRQDSVAALGVCLQIVLRRDNAVQEYVYSNIWKEVVSGMRQQSIENVHGSLLVYRELLVNAGQFMHPPKYDDALTSVLRLKDHKDHIIRRTVIEILPSFAMFLPQLFSKNYLDEAMAHLLLQLNAVKSPDRAPVFLSIGQIALAVRVSMANYIDNVLIVVRETLATAKARVRREQEPAIFKCLGMMAEAFGQAFTKYLDRPLLGLLFSCGLTRQLYECLSSFFKNIPALREEIRTLLLDIISHGLSGYNYRIPGQPEDDGIANDEDGEGYLTMSETLAHDYREQMLAKIGGDEGGDTDVITSFLKILSEFDFQGRTLAPFCRDCVLRWADNSDPKIRKAAALTCCSVFAREPIANQISGNALHTVQIVLQKLLKMAVTDSQYDIRLDILKALDSKLDAHLSQPANVKVLFVAVNDEVFLVRLAAISVLGRLSRINPAYVVPSLRKTMIELLTDLEYSKNSRSKEESARLLSALMRGSHALVRPYVDPILKVFVNTAQHATVSTVSSAVMDASGELCAVGGKRMLAHVPDLMPPILEMLNDQASVTRCDTALRTLGKLASHSEYIIDPYYQYPRLLGTLIKILVTDSNAALQRETVKLIGILGALDPYKYREIERDLEQEDEGAQQQIPIDVKLVLRGTPPSSEDYNPTVVITSLMALLKDPATAGNHARIVQAVLRIFQNLDLKSVLFLDEVIPGLIQAMRSNSLAMADVLFRQISTLTTVVKQHIRPYLPQIFSVMNEYFAYPILHAAILVLVESLANALAGEFKVYMPEILPALIGLLQSDDNDSETSIASKIRALHSLPVLGESLSAYVHLIIPNVVNLFYYVPQVLRIAALNCISDLSQLLRLDDMASRIILPLIRVLNSTYDDEVRYACLETLCNVCYQLGSGFFVFVDTVQPAVQRLKSQVSQQTSNHEAQSGVSTAASNRLMTLLNTYDKLVSLILRNEPIPAKLNPHSGPDVFKSSQPPPASEQKTMLQIYPEILKHSWDTTGRSTRDDWTEWFRRISVEFLKQSPSPAMRACADIAVISPSLARDLFNPSFYTVWVQLDDNYKDDLIRHVQNAMASTNIPPEVLQTLLTLAEFMERDDKPFPLSPRVLAGYAQKCHAYAKALHYKELDFMADPSSSTIESLIAINNQLQQSDAAVGILKHAQQHHSLQLKETWYEKLQRWQEALAAYKEREKLEPGSMEVIMGKMRSLHALGEWEQLSAIARERWETSSPEARRAVAPLAAAAAWGLGEWEEMDRYVRVIRSESPDRSFFNSILCLHRSNFGEAEHQIQRARDQLIPELTALVSESYNRAYGVVVRVQMLAELEEIMHYKSLGDYAEEERESLRRTWEKRLMGCQHNVDIWQRILNVRTLVMEPKENMAMWIKFANLCRKSNRLALAEKSLNSLLDVDDHQENRAPPQVVYAQLKFMWTTGNQQEALDYLVDFTTRMSKDLNLNSSYDLITQPLPSEMPNSTDEIQEYTKLLARCFLKQGEWQVVLNNNWYQQPERMASILGSYMLATHFDPQWYKAWHNWAIANFEVVSLAQREAAALKEQENDSQIGISTRVSPVSEDENEVDVDMAKDDIVPPCDNGTESPVELTAAAALADPGKSLDNVVIQKHVVAAIRGFFHSITLAHKSALQDTLRLITLWFTYGGLPEPSRALSDGFQMVNVDNWLDVVPQLISRIHQTDEVVREALYGLLIDLGKKHPQALVYPLQVSIKSDNEFRKNAAQKIFDTIRLHSSATSVLFEQAEMVSHELIRVAVLWHELWHEGLEDASRDYFVEKNIPKMFSILDPLHAMVANGATTLREMSFEAAFGKELHDAQLWGDKYKRTHDEKHLNQAWDIYYNVFQRLNRQLLQMSSLNLQYVSPALLNARNLSLAVFGSYEPSKPVITMQSFDPTLSVISSKQRPRRFMVYGNDGKKYLYLVKGHEDLRQDSLVMQLFGLVNTLLADNPECFKRHLSIQRFPVIPLSPKAGLLGWVPHSDTLHYLIREFREGKYMLNIEHRFMLQMAPNYESLTHLQKIEVFTYALDNTKGQDLYKILWLKSQSSEAWLNRRTEYTRSLAVMSMVGYILGLGDRHPLNLMLDRVTGRVIHIDFGDCFEAAILREKFPEKVPFRLTRMLTYAMEVSGVEGSFRITCEHVMALLRDNSESLMAILEAFANDPLINWGFDLPRELRGQIDGQSGKFPSILTMTGVSEGDDLNEEQEREAYIKATRAQLVLRRIWDKFTGNDFSRHRDLNVPDQVDLLIQEATNIENLCQHFLGWCSFW